MTLRTARYARALALGRILFIAILAAAAAFYVYRSIGWHWMHDESIMRYVNFLMDHGQAPYRDIIDPNMPGSFFLDGWATRIVGKGDLGWRFYEFFLLGLLTASMMVIARPYDWFAGLFGGVLFVLVHAIDGPINAVQRDEIMTVLILAAYAFVFEALRRRRPLLMLPFGLLLGLAASLKPTAVPLGLVLLLMVAITLRKRKVAAASYVGSGLAGLGAASVIVLAFLLKHNALGAFIEITKRMLPYYAGLGNLPPLDLLRHLSILALAVLLPFALPLTIANTDWDWERLALALGVCFGAASFFVQRKGFVYHRYPLYAFLFLWIGLELVRGLRRSGWRRGLGLVGVALGVLCVVPVYALRLTKVQSAYDLPVALQQDLVRLGGDRLQDQVQCLDMVSGCLTALYRMGLVQTTSFMGDYMLFQPRGGAVPSRDREAFWRQIHARPPKVIVVTNQWLMEKSSFSKLDQWPELVSFLESNYRIDTTRTFGPEEYVVSYRIYVRLSPEPTLSPAASPVSPP